MWTVASLVMALAAAGLAGVAQAAGVCPDGVDVAPTHWTLLVGPAGLRLANGTLLPQLAYNGTIVGPTLRATLGDDVSVDVVNELDIGTTIHWHGLDQPGSPWADGVAGITQPPIPPRTTFRYRFKAEPAGTHWYHSHTGLQYGDGLRGAFVVADRAQQGPDVPADVVLLLADQADRSAAAVLAELQTGGMTMGGGGMGTGSMAMGGSNGSSAVAEAPAAPAAPAPTAVQAASAHPDTAVGGRRRLKQHAGMAGMDMGASPAVAGIAPTPAGGAHGTALPPVGPPPLSSLPDPRTGCTFQSSQDLSDAPYYATLVNGQGWAVGGDGRGVGSPHVVAVTPGRSYRLRVINGAASWGYNVSVDGHALKLVALDGYELAPAAVSGVVLTPGESADLLLTADQAVANYWIRVTTLSGYGGPAVLHYEGAPDPAADARLGPPPVATGCAAATTPGVLDLKNATGLVGAAATPAPPATANRTLAMYLTLNSADPAPPAGLVIPGYARPRPPPGCPPAGGAPSRYCWGINWVVFSEPVGGLPLEGLAFGADGLAVPSNGSSPAPRDASAAAAGAVSDYAVPVTLGEVVDIVFVNPGAMVHPMHLHGMAFWVLAAGNGDPPLTPAGGVDARRANLANPVMRNTVPVPNAAPGLGDGYAVVRVRASNPGPWALHCHIDYHAAAGMFAYVAVRDPARAPLQWPTPPSGLGCKGVAGAAPRGGAVTAATAPEFAPFATAAT